MSESTKNVFSKGLNTDTSPALFDQSSMLSAYNVTLSADSNYHALSNLQGNNEIEELFSKGSLALIKATQILGVFAVDWLNTDNSTTSACLTIFTGEPSGNFTIYVYNTIEDTLSIVYTESFTTAKENANVSIDAIISKESNVNTLYFTDNIEPLRKLKCEYPNTYIAADLKAIKDTSYGTVTTNTVGTTGGGLFCGSYQAAYRCINNTTNKYSNFSLLSNPTFIFKEPSDSGNVVHSYGDVGISTTHKITYDVTLSEAELVDYDYYQIVIVEDLDGLGNFVNGKLQDPVAIGGVVLHTFIYKNNTSVGSVTIDEITVDKAQVATNKTLLVKDNVLMLGNVTYEELTYDQGEPTILDTTTVLTNEYTGSNANSNRGLYTQQDDATKQGHFRDEVYRYYISHFNDRGMYARPRLLDFTTVTNNVATVGLDFKYPPRSDSNYTIINSSQQLRALGLDLKGVDNHPTWSKGFVILRAIRKKNIKFQSPLIPTSYIQPSPAIYEYPTNPDSYDSVPVVLEAQPPTNVSGTYIPKSFFRVVTRNIVQRSITAGQDPEDDCEWEADTISGGDFQSGTCTMVAAGLNGTLSSPTVDFSSMLAGDTLTITVFANANNNGEFLVVSNGTASSVVITHSDGGGNPVNESAAGGVSITHTGPGSGAGKESKGNDHVHCIFNPGEMYTDINGLQASEYTFTGSDRLKTIDIALLNHTTFKHDVTTDYESGDYTNTNITGTFFASNSEQYYYHPVTTNPTPSIPTANAEIVSYDLLANNNAGVTLPYKRGNMVTNSFGDHAGLVAVGLDEGIPPDQLKMSVVVTNEPKLDIATLLFDNTDGYKTSNTISLESNTFSGIDTLYSPVLASISGDDSPNNFFFGASSSGTAHPSEDVPVGAVELVNIEAGLADDRYGNAEDFHEVQATGAAYVFSTAELVDVVAGTSLPINIEVWGGDCFLGQVNYKLGTSTYSLPDEGENGQTASEFKWGASLYGQATPKIAQRPIPLDGVGEILSVYIESEINTEVTGNSDDTLKEIADISGDAVRSVRASTGRAIGNSRDQFSYYYHPAYTNQNSQKVFVPYDSFERVNNTFTNRILYSDTKVYQSDIGGFDTFRANNFYDLDETYGGLTKLLSSSSRTYGILEDGVVYIPINSSAIETDDTAQLSVRSSEYIGKPKYINTSNGTSNFRTVAQTPSSFFFYDENNKQVLMFENGQGKIISDSGMISTFNTLPAIVNDRELFAFYDINKGAYSIIHSDVPNGTYSGHKFNTKFGFWEHSYDFGTNGALLSGAYSNKSTFHVGLDFTQFNMSVYQDDAGTYNQWFNQLVEPRITIIVNPKVDIAKTFNNLRVHATYPLKDVDLLVIKDVAQLNQIANGINLDILPREDYYRLKIPRDEKGARLRGGLLQGTFNWEETSNKKVTLNSIITKYLPSRRII
jgi:hypothetical protein